MARHGVGIKREAVALAQLVDQYRTGGPDRFKAAMQWGRDMSGEDLMQTLESAVGVIVGLTDEGWSAAFIDAARNEQLVEAEAARLRAQLRRVDEGA